jgi:hypothetical protein
MTHEPDFRDLVGDEGAPEDLDRLRRVHDLLVAAGPPPELSPTVAEPPRVEESNVLAFRLRRTPAVFALAAAIFVGLVIGYAVAGRQNSFESARSVPMHGVGQLAAARAQIEIGTHDTGGNYPLKMTVSGLPHLPQGGWYELLLSKHGHPTLSCGSFAVDGQNETLRLSVPYELTSGFGKLFDGWVVTRHLPNQRSAPVVMTT